MNNAIIRGTTPTFMFSIQSSQLSLENITTCVCSFVSGQKQIDIFLNQSDFNLEDNTISVSLTQSQTLQLHDSSKVQLRLMDNSGNSYATPIMQIPVLDVLYERVIHE